jgi:hypothetical protein
MSSYRSSWWDREATFIAVMPAKAGIQIEERDWIPAFAGMTT